MNHLIGIKGSGEILLWLPLIFIAGFLMWMGHRLNQTQPRLAKWVDHMGSSVGLLTIFGIISNHLPTNTRWVPWLCCAFTLLAQLLLLQDRIMDQHPNYELIKAMLGQGIAAIAVLTIGYKPSFSSVLCLVLISTSVGVAAIWAGLQMMDILPYFATGLMKLGVAIVVITFFGLLSMYLPAIAICVPCFCCVVSLVAALCL